MVGTLPLRVEFIDIHLQIWEDFCPQKSAPVGNGVCVFFVNHHHIMIRRKNTWKMIIEKG